MENSVIIGIAGGSGSGKTTITMTIIKLTTTCRLSSESC